jgi:flagellar hook protein FlgE
MSSATGNTGLRGGSNPSQVGYGVTVSSIDVNNSIGGLMSTESPMDLYIAGDGYFMVQGNNSTNYTRVGDFTFDATGALVNSQGDYILGWQPSHSAAAAAPITIANITDYTNVSVGTNGVVTGVYSGTAAGHTVGAIETLAQIGVAKFPNPDGLAQIGGSYLQESTNSGTPVQAAPGTNATGLVISNRLEMSNVNLANELTDMITTQRGYQANSRVITTSDQMLEELVNLKR